VIIPMARIRLLGPRGELAAVLDALQDLGVVQLDTPKHDPRVHPVTLSPERAHERAHLERLLDDLETIATELGLPFSPNSHETPGPPPWAEWIRLAARIRRRLAALRTREVALTDERALIAKYEGFFAAFDALLRAEPAIKDARAYHVILRARDADALPRLRTALTEALGDEFALLQHRLPDGEVAVLLLVAAAVAPKVESMLAQAGVHEMPVPAEYGGASLAEAMPAMRARRDAIPRELAAIAAERRALAERHGAELARARRAAHDRLLALQGETSAAETERAFVLEGWVPDAAIDRVRKRLAECCAPTIVIERIGREDWEGREAPVVLSNPRLFRPFEMLSRMFPLPRYGSIDPTPFVAVFFPMFFGLMLGDIGYGLLLGVLALLLMRHAAPDALRRSLGKIAGACALFAVLFGIAFGEFFGDLGRRVGLHPLLFDREARIVPFLGLAIAIGLVHIVLGLVLGVVSAARGHPRQAVGRGLAAVMVLLIAAALLAVVEVLPHALFSPLVIALLVAFPILVVVEGVIGPIELLSTLGNVLSYARIMALGTASVMMAVVANRLVGTMGSVAVGVVFALIFHFVNFALGIFSPTIHALRLHYVEFFGKFYSPGGTEYRPFGHWHPNGEHAG